MNTRTVAVIDIGTSSIRMALADIDEQGGIQFLEKLNQSVRLGQDVFTRGRLRRSTIDACVRIMESFQQVMKEYRVGPEQVRAVATSAVQEAANRDSLLDRIAMTTGIEIEIIDDAEVTRLTYLSVLPFLSNRRRGSPEHTLVMEVGGGRTEMLFLRKQTIEASQVMRLGSVRLQNLLESRRTLRERIAEVLDQEIDNSLHQLQDEFRAGNPSLIALGGEARFLAMQINPDWDRDGIQPVPLKKWKSFVADLLALSVEQIVDRYHLTFSEAETLVPALYAFARFAEHLGCRQLQVSAYTMRDGLLQELAQQDGWNESYRRQMIESAIKLGKKFDLDLGHGEEVAGLALQLFDELEEEHRLGSRHRVILQLACLLHEIGTIISPTSHHKHSMYILAHTPIFGLGRRDSRLVANIARYHRRSTPKSSHPFYQALSRHDRLIVQQLAAILRIADALARSRGRRIRTIVCERGDGTLFVRVPDVDNLHLENRALETKGQMFEQVFGMNVIFVKG